MTQLVAADPMDQQWCCLTCSAKFPFKKVIMRQGRSLHCPQCKSDNIHPADQTEHVLANYDRDDKGTAQ